jgi:hypothetical protein
MGEIGSKLPTQIIQLQHWPRDQSGGIANPTSPRPQALDCHRASSTWQRPGDLAFVSLGLFTRQTSQPESATHGEPAKRNINVGQRRALGVPESRCRRHHDSEAISVCESVAEILMQAINIKCL